MDARTFSEMRAIDKLNMTGLKVGDKFLFGTKMVAQKEEKQIGEMITYYEVIGISSQGNVEYSPRYERLKEF